MCNCYGSLSIHRFDPNVDQIHPVLYVFDIAPAYTGVHTRPRIGL